MKIDYEQLRNGEAKPRLHPNGFIQLDLGDRKRFHVWPETPLLPTVRKEPIHDHTFSFDSEVMLGSLTHTVYDLVEDENGMFEVYTVQPFLAVGKETPLVKETDRRYRLDISKELVISAGQTYHFDAFLFHDSQPHGLTASIMSYGEVDPSKRARVLHVVGQPSPETFDRDQIDVEVLWQEIQTACRLMAP